MCLLRAYDKLISHDKTWDEKTCWPDGDDTHFRFERVLILLFCIWQWSWVWGWCVQPNFTQSSDDKLILSNLPHKERKEKLSLWKLNKQSIEHIQKFAHSFSLQSSNRFLSASENRFVHHYWATNIHAHQSVGFHSFVHKDIIFALACHLRFSHHFSESLAKLSEDYSVSIHLSAF